MELHLLAAEKSCRNPDYTFEQFSRRGVTYAAPAADDPATVVSQTARQGDRLIFPDLRPHCSQARLTHWKTFDIFTQGSSDIDQEYRKGNVTYPFWSHPIPKFVSNQGGTVPEDLSYVATLELAGIPLGNKETGKTLIHIQQSAPVVERRPLAAYESLAGGAR